MTRLMAVVTGIAAGAAAAVLIVGSASTEPARVDAIFDNAKGMVAGQSVKIAGTKVGSVDAVHLERTRGGGYKARFELTVERRFTPFRADARCRILPQGLISENYIDCDPGTPGRPALRAVASGIPTVPLARTGVPASLQDVLDVFAAPTSQRIRLMLNELGIATAGRGEDINSILRRSNPALSQARRVLKLIDAQITGLTRAIGGTDRILASLARRGGDVRAFVRRASSVAQTTGAHRDALEQSVKRLPAMLTAVDRSLGPIGRATRAGIPLLHALREAAPSVDELNSTIPPFVKAGEPAVRSLGAAARTGRSAVRSAGPVVRSLATLARRTRPSATLLNDYLVSVRDKGGIEGLGSVLYGLAVATASYDATSHFIIAAPYFFPGCIIANMQPGTQVTPGCSHAYTAPGMGRVTSDLPPTTPSALASSVGTARTASTGNSRADARRIRSLLDFLLK